MAFLVRYSKSPPSEDGKDKAIYLDHNFYGIIFTVCSRENSERPLLQDIAFLGPGDQLIIPVDQVGRLLKELERFKLSQLPQSQFASFASVCRTAIESGWDLIISGNMRSVLTYQPHETAGTTATDVPSSFIATATGLVACEPQGRVSVTDGARIPRSVRIEAAMFRIPEKCVVCGSEDCIPWTYQQDNVPIISPYVTVLSYSRITLPYCETHLISFMEMSRKLRKAQAIAALVFCAGLCLVGFGEILKEETGNPILSHIAVLLSLLFGLLLFAAFYIKPFLHDVFIKSKGSRLIVKSRSKTFIKNLLLENPTASPQFPGSTKKRHFFRGDSQNGANNV